MKKILIVEDDEKNRILLGDILRYYGYEVIEAVDGREGIEKAKEHKPELIFMDLQMPVMNGFETLKILRDDPDTEGIKIIAVTSFAMKGDRERALETGFDDYIAKPINTRQLPEMVKKFLGD